MVRPGYKQTEVGEIPEDWDEANLGDYSIKVGSGITPKGGANVYKETGRPFVRSQNIGWGNLRLADLAFIDEETHQTFLATEIHDEDVLLNITGASIGRCSVANKQLEGGNVNQHVCIIRTNKELDHKYLSYVLLSSIGQKQIDSFQAGGNREGLNFGQIRSFILLRPKEINEQKAIAKALSDVDELIVSLEKLIAKKRDIKTATMQQLLTGKKRLPGFGEGKGYKHTELGEIPEDWGIKYLRELANFKNGKAHENDIKDDGKYIVVNSKFISTEGEIKKYSDYCHCSTSKNNILMVMSDVPNGRAIAKCFFVDECDKYTVNQRICSIELIKDNPEFIFYLLNRNPYYLSFDDGVKQTNLRKDDVLNCPVVVPMLIEEQTSIAKVIFDMDELIASIENRLEKTKSIKQGMMQELLTGRTRLISGKLKVKDRYQLSTVNSQLPKGPLWEKSFAFALRIVKMSKYLSNDRKEFVLSKQILRSGTAIGALVREAEHAQSKADFINKMNIALKEANETDYWIELLHQSGEITQESYQSIKPDIQELLKLLVSIVKTSKERTAK